jgi:uncharacterized protein
LTDALVLNVAELTRRPATRKAYELVVPAEGLALGGPTGDGARVEDDTPVVVDVVVESLTDGLTVNGEVRTVWQGTCRRCLGPASGELVAEVSELYQVHPTSDDAFAFDGEQLDLGPMVRELVLMELPPAPLCRADCAGICAQCGADRNAAPCSCQPELVDPRWASLEQLRERLESEP